MRTRWCVEAYVTTLETNSTLHGKKTCNEGSGSCEPPKQLHPNHSSPARYLNLSISNNISQTVCGALPFRSSVASPINTIRLLPFSDFCCPQQLPTRVSASASAQSAGLSSMFCHLLITLPMLCPFFSSLVHSGPTAWHLSSSFFKICALPLHAVGFVNSCRSPALPSAFLII